MASCDINNVSISIKEDVGLGGGGGGGGGGITHLLHRVGEIVLVGNVLPYKEIKTYSSSRAQAA